MKPFNCIAAMLLILTLAACDKHTNTEAKTNEAKPAVQPASPPNKPDEKIEVKAQQPELVETKFTWSGDFEMNVDLPKHFVSKTSDDLNPSILEPETPLIPTGSVRNLVIKGAGEIALNNSEIKDGYIQTSKFGVLQIKVLAVNIENHRMKWRVYATPAQITELTKFVEEAGNKK